MAHVVVTILEARCAGGARLQSGRKFAHKDIDGEAGSRALSNLNASTRIVQPEVAPFPKPPFTIVVTVN
jgi:hypothetical protein